VRVGKTGNVITGEAMSGDENWGTVAQRNALEAGSVTGVKPGDLDVALYNIDGEIFATYNICNVSDSWLDGNIIGCPRTL
jgi:nitrite reductase/ring-hydroxylating ferredoxin subunit